MISVSGQSNFSERAECRDFEQSPGILCYVWVFLGFLKIVPKDQRTVGSVLIQFI